MHDLAAAKFAAKMIFDKRLTMYSLYFNVSGPNTSVAGPEERTLFLKGHDTKEF